METMGIQLGPFTGEGVLPIMQDRNVPPKWMFFCHMFPYKWVAFLSRLPTNGSCFPIYGLPFVFVFVIGKYILNHKNSPVDESLHHENQLTCQCGCRNLVKNSLYYY